MNPLQRASARRKAIYFAAILGLFTVSMFWRGTIPIPLSTARAGEPTAVNRAAERVASKTILRQSLNLELREVEEGEQDLEGAAFRLALLGSRGLVVASLWHSTIEAQKRNDFHKMEGLIRQVTQLQPHFITPWIFQSWNIAYNVSVEMQGSGDMYFYIANGIELLAEGERRQGRVEPGTGRRLGSPDMRYQIAFFYQNKFGVSDNVEVLRCLFQLSCISPDDRNPDDLEERDDRGERVVNPRKFREFCEKYPHLVRRLRGERRGSGGDEATAKKIAEALKCSTPREIVQFLRDNKDVPGRYRSKKELYADAYKQFPVLPPKFNETEANPGSETGDDFTAFKTARAWYAYSTVPVPETWPPRDANDKPMPAGTPQPGEYDPVRYRVPRQPMLIIFCQGAPRAQSYQAEMEQKEGWFDDEGWRIDDPTDSPANWWFPDDPVRPTRPLDVVVGGTRRWSLEEWRAAARMWTEHGEKYGLVIEPARLENYKSEAARRPPDGAPAEAVERWQRASSAVFYYGTNRQVTNFPYFLAAAIGESRVDAAGRPITVLARKTLWQAERARRLGNKLGPRGAIALYREGLELWKQVLAADREFHRPPNGSERTEEETYGYELAYLRLLVQDDQTVRARAAELGRDVQAAFHTLPVPFGAAGRFVEVRDVQDEFKWHTAERVVSPFAKPIGDADGVADDRRGGPWVGEGVKSSVRQTQGVERKPLTAPPPQPPSGGPGDGP
ncbi:Uncharacterized protein OS=Isosphaera pallida (strain ATCC 43644 / DSM 9630 / IS1B) GN=Isop_3426 PE=4 SV=1 [Gemmataceae bacterium]|nr:Uncharacterized protein OS=Isosphaera pallida (strain ATCC 43644 / DSM 9630 / IS1B) GN=Isop_3426 PE=4 SV=1 [Gemmataceae bacterium]VTU01808.1 Uncharacterized protein OS=Isosphaera pallida (strain ATCC 43644 / DSM 9630 / IS1B) GN=Isop_3426 PE=4 SV=1 [Gemmataceae bacterium]